LVQEYFCEGDIDEMSPFLAVEIFNAKEYLESNKIIVGFIG
jgi:uncharacterized protein YuzE